MSADQATERLSDDVKIDDLDLDVRISNALRNAELTTVGDLRERGSQGLLRIPGFGRQSLRYVEKVIGSWQYDTNQERAKLLNDRQTNIKELSRMMREIGQIEFRLAAVRMFIRLDKADIADALRRINVDDYLLPQEIARRNA